MRQRARSKQDTVVLDALGRLEDAALVGALAPGLTVERGGLLFTSTYHQLLLAGRRPSREPAFREAWATGDPANVARWVEREAALLTSRHSPPRHRVGPQEAAQEGPDDT